MTYAEWSALSEEQRKERERSFWQAALRRVWWNHYYTQVNDPIVPSWEALDKAVETLPVNEVRTMKGEPEYE